jgi:hypothetical protein
MIMESIFEQAMNAQRRPSPEQQLERLRKRNKELQLMSQIKRLEFKEKKYRTKMREMDCLERNQRIAVVKGVGSSFVNVIKAGHNKISCFEKSRMKAKTFNYKEKTRPSICD